jgi:hypothetical protein
MVLIRPIRLLPVKPTRERLLWIQRTYGISRKSLARLMRCNPGTVDRYLRPEGAVGAQSIPLGRFELLLFKVAAIYRDEEIELPL